ncbi:1-acyl-sn-glycerol-3-phosphate acyltransferase [Baekduia soli]|uniref:1-acyl-sn-glycerol-3-phosphate acyltransferase n=1 Tax=Baekduia soli TaxID=496014 RepID=A0A5B8UAL4_9ACTN|nr:lysophospholipid acyltransferase family protein [Baekduia soli]QEC50233.1 1-acyl-sn-glycerol-3-phosphate acyltransferase [Baekduia soli]
MSEQEQLASMKAQVYRDPRPKEFFDRFHERARTKPPNWAYEAVRICTALYSLVFFRARAISAEKVPPSGPVILAPNHFSFMDHFFVAAFIRRKVRFMAKSQLFSIPMQWVYSPGGVFPVRRGARDEEAFITANTILGHGGCVAMYCEGGRSRTGALAAEAKPGIGRLALQSGATIVPVAIHGSSRVRNWKKLQFPKVTIQFGEPFRFEQVAEPTREQSSATANAIFDEIKVLYAGLEAHGRSGIVARVRAERRAARRAAKAKRAAPA